MRQPGQLLRDLGLPGFLTFQLIVVGNALAALVHPLFTAGLFYSVLGGAPMWRGDSASVVILAAVYGMTVVIGYLTSAFLGWLGLLRRGLLSTAWILLLTPVHWLLLSLAALRLPLPLGGSSNHFYTAILREVGGWDPYNVTEDAISACGSRVSVIDRT